MRYTLPVVLFLAVSCASPAPSTYERGTPARPTPAPARPGVGLPIPWQPHSRPEVQPQPRPKRYLPPEPDGKPGIWASDAPDDQPNILGVPPPVYEGSADENPAPFAYCVHAMNRALDNTDFRRFVLSHPDKTAQRCFAAHLYRLCAGKTPGHNAQEQATSSAKPRAMEAADKLIRTMCKGPLDPVLESAKGLISTEYDRGVQELFRKGGR